MINSNEGARREPWGLCQSHTLPKQEPPNLPAQPSLAQCPLHIPTNLSMPLLPAPALPHVLSQKRGWWRLSVSSCHAAAQVPPSASEPPGCAVATTLPEPSSVLLPRSSHSALAPPSQEPPHSPQGHMPPQGTITSGSRNLLMVSDLSTTIVLNFLGNK